MRLTARRRHELSPAVVDVLTPTAPATPAPEPTKGGAVENHTDIVIGPIETRARQLVGARPEHVTESEYIYKVRELVDWMATVDQQWREAAKGGGRT